MTGERYWAQRAEKRLWEALAEAEEAANDVAKAYRASARYLQQEARRVMRTFARKSGLTEREALRILKLAGSGDLRAIKKALARMSANPSVKELETILSSPAYAARIKRFESLLSDVQKQTVNLRQLQAEAVRRTLVDTVAGTYYKTIFDLQQRSGAAFSFDAVSPQYIETILDEKIAGKNYSERIWRNTNKLAQKLREQLLMDAMTGASEVKSARRIAEAMESSASDARRLIRTETTRAVANATLESFKRCRIKRYQFVATLDLRTSELCAALDGKEFDVAEAKTGVNMPPMHPYCRSVIVTALTAQERARLQRAALDPKTGKSIRVPADMTYKEWYDKYVKPKAAGLAASGGSEGEIHDPPKLLEKLEKVDYNIAVEKLKQYEPEIADLDVENAIVVTQDGEVWRCFGTERRVFPDEDLGEKLRGAYVTHNHPYEHTEYSFSDADFELFDEFELEVLRGVDDRYAYQLSRKELEVDIAPSFAEIQSSDDLMMHDRRINDANTWKVGYRRKKR